jgi:hypothetical protein
MTTQEGDLQSTPNRSELATNILNTSHLHKFQTAVQGSMRWRGETKLKSAEISNTNHHICHLSCSDPLLRFVDDQLTAKVQGTALRDDPTGRTTCLAAAIVFSTK